VAVVVGGCKDANIIAQGLFSCFNDHTGCRRAEDMDALGVALAAGEDANVYTAKGALSRFSKHACRRGGHGRAGGGAGGGRGRQLPPVRLRRRGQRAGELRAEVAAAGDAAAAAEAARQAAARARPRPCAGPSPVGGAQGARMSRSACPDASARAGLPPRTCRYAHGSCGLQRGSQTACCPCSTWCALCRDLRKGRFLGVLQLHSELGGMQPPTDACTRGRALLGGQELEERLAATEAAAGALEARRDAAVLRTTRLREGLAALWQARGARSSAGCLATCM